MNISKVALPLVALALPACTSTEGLRPDISSKPLPSRLDEIAYINTLRSALEEGKGSTTDLNCFTGSGLKPFKSKLGQGYRKGDDPEQFVHDSKGLNSDVCVTFRELKGDNEAQKAERDRKLGEYLDAGFGLTDIYCNRFFTVAIASQRNRAFAHSELASVDNMVTAVLGATGAGETALAVTGAAFGLGGKSLEGYDLAYMVSPNMPDVQRLVTAEQRAFRDAYAEKGDAAKPVNYLQARRIVEAYAHICSFSGMKQLVDKSIKDRTDNLNPKPGDEPDNKGDDNGDSKGTGKGDDKSGDGDKPKPIPDRANDRRVMPQMANPPS